MQTRFLLDAECCEHGGGDNDGDDAELCVHRRRTCSVNLGRNNIGQELGITLVLAEKIHVLLDGNLDV